MDALLAAVPTLLNFLLFAIMFGMGTTLTVGNFRAVARFPAAVGVGLLNQLVLLPLVALGLVTLLPLPPDIALGVLLISFCPGGATSNLLTHLAGGDTALSIALTACSSLLTILSIPFLLNWSLDYLAIGGGQPVRLPVGPTLLNILRLTALPVALGMGVRHWLPRRAAAARPAVAWGAGLVVVLALVLMLLKLGQLGSIPGFVRVAGPAVLLLGLLTFGLGYGSARSFGLGRAQAVTVSLETGVQNNVLAMAIALSPAMLDLPPAATAAGIYGLWMCVVGGAVATLMARTSHRYSPG